MTSSENLVLKARGQGHDTLLALIILQELKAGGVGAESSDTPDAEKEKSAKELGRQWGQTLRDLGADVGVIGETRLLGESRHKAVEAGLLEKGYVAYSHNTEVDEKKRTGQNEQTYAGGYRGAGVIVAVAQKKAT